MIETIELDEATTAFYNGVAAGTQVNEAHAGLPFPDHETQVKMYWFYVGVLAVDQYNVGNDGMDIFITGAAVRQP